MDNYPLLYTNNIKRSKPVDNLCTTLHRLETDDRTVGGVLFTFPSGAMKSATWRSQTPIQDTLSAAKDYAAHVVQALLKEGKQDDIDRTNWTSAVAAVQKHIIDFNHKLRASIPVSGITIDS